MTADQVTTLLQHLEEQLLQPATRSNPEAVAALLTDDFREFGSSGIIYSKASILAALASESPASLTMTDFTCQLPAPDVAHVTYRSTRFPGHITALRSSLWIFRDDRWQMLFHQGTQM